MNLFKDFFEHYGKQSEPLGPKDIPQDILNDFRDDSLYTQENTQESFKSYDHGFFSDPTDFLSEFEETLNDFFNGFPVMAFPLPDGNEILSQQDPWKSPDDEKSLQERMLNDKKKDSLPGRPSPFPFSFHDWRSPERTSPYYNTTKGEDKNLDEDFQKGDKCIDDILPRGEKQMAQGSSSTLSYFSSSVVTRNWNGIIETKKTVRDSSGNEEVTITRKVGDEEYTISNKTDGDDANETNESVDADTGENNFGMLTPERPPTIDHRSSFYHRLRNWFDNERD